MSESLGRLDDDAVSSEAQVLCLIAADVIKGGDLPEENIATLLNSVPLEAGLLLDTEADRLTAEVAERIAREARYRVARTLGVPVEGRDDPIIDAAIACLAIQPSERQARVLEVTAYRI